MRYVLIILLLMTNTLRLAEAQSAAPATAPTPASSASVQTADSGASGQSSAAGSPSQSSGTSGGVGSAQGSASSAQSTAADQSAPAGAPADQTPAPPAFLSAPVINPPPVHIPQGLVRLGWEDTNVTGNEQKFEHYATPPNGIYLDELRYTPYSKIGDTGVIDFESPFEPDYRDYTQLALFNGYTQVEGLLSKNRFFDVGPFYGTDTGSLSPSDRAVQELYVRQRIANWLSVSTRYNMIQQDNTFDTPDPLVDLHQRTRYDDLALVGLAAGGWVNLVFSDWHYFDRTQVLDNTDVKRWEGSYQYNLGSEVLTAKCDWLTVESAGAADGHVQISSLTDDIDLGGSTSGQLDVREDKLNMPVVQNSYVREQESATASLAKSFGGGWDAAMAFQDRSAQRINNNSTGVSEPHWQTEELEIDGNLGRGWRMLANGWATNLYDSPQMQTSDPDTLLWTNTQYADVRLDGVADAIQGYIDWAYNRNANDQRSTVIQESIYNVGGDWQALPVLDVYLDYTDDLWTANDDMATLPTLDEYVPGSRVTTLGLNWVVAPRTDFSASFSGFETSASNPLLLPDTSTSGRFLTLDFQQSTLRGQTFGLVLAPWAYRDMDVDSYDYNTAVVKLTASTPF